MANHGVSVPGGAPPLVSQSHAAQESWVIGFLSGASEPAINRRGIPGPGPLLPASKPGSSCQGTDCWGAQEEGDAVRRPAETSEKCHKARFLWVSFSIALQTSGTIKQLRFTSSTKKTVPQ
ncbi:unnamed protein product [Boreogadus saida]